MHRRRGILTALLVASLLPALAPASAARAGDERANRADAAHHGIAAAAAKAFRLDLADRNDFVPQTTFVQCVGASMQMMLNIMGGADRSAATQLRLQRLARNLSGPTRAGFERKGASVRGWTAALNTLQAGPYRLIGTDTVQEAMRVAARSIRDTGRPVGLLVWAGRHAWVMSGFEATADPRRTNRFTVTKVIVLDPLYPYGSSKWGPSPRPRQAITLSTLATQFVPRRRGTWAGALPGPDGAGMRALAGKYVIVMPFTPIKIARARHVAT
jgi:hypothetical protein